MKKEQPFNLTNLTEGQEAVVVSIVSGPGANKRLADLGLTPQTRIKLIRKALFRGPIEIEVRGSKLVIGRRLASKIQVSLPQACPYLKDLHIVLAGQANVGKSVIFNHLTGLHQHIGNWPGKTVEKAEGTLYYQGRTIDIVDLPGIYSLSTYSLEEIISRDYIFSRNPDFVINVIDATNLERNLLFTLQLLELERPMVLAANMVNLLKEKGIKIDYARLSEILQIPVVKVEAIYGKGITEVLDQGIRLTEHLHTAPPPTYGKEVEEIITGLTASFDPIHDFPYPKRWLAIKLLEKDGQITEMIAEKSPQTLELARRNISELEKLHGHDSSVVIAGERCHLVAQIVAEVVSITPPSGKTMGEKLDWFSAHKYIGMPFLILVMLSMFAAIFKFGNWLSGLMEQLFSGWHTAYSAVLGHSFWASLGWSAIESGLALLQVALPYILSFYLLLYLLEDLGYMARIAFLTDNLMHKLGIHGKACIPLLLGYGCNVPACLGCKILETQRERLIAGFLSTLVPCSARTVIIFGLVGKFVGIWWALGLYLLNLAVIFVLGRVASKILPGEPTELIMEMPEYKSPHLKTIVFQLWLRLKEFIIMAAPLVIISGVVIQGLYLLGWLKPIVEALSPITVNWLGLPVMVGILLIFGILRKELILVMLAALLGTTNFAQALSPVQMITLALVSMFYVPCISTIAVLKQEFGWKKALAITLFEIILALLLGGIVSRLLALIF